MLFSQDRKILRDQFRHAWKKRLANETLDPLEKQIVTFSIRISPANTRMKTRFCICPYIWLCVSKWVRIAPKASIP